MLIKYITDSVHQTMRLNNQEFKEKPDKALFTTTTELGWRRGHSLQHSNSRLQDIFYYQN